MLPFSEACERNKGPILDVLQGAFAGRSVNQAAIQSTAEQETAWVELQEAYLRQQQSGQSEDTENLETDLRQATDLLTTLLKQENLIS